MYKNDFEYEINCSSFDLDHQRDCLLKYGAQENKAELARLKRMEFCYNYRNSLKIEDTNSSGQFLINDTFIYSPASGKWRVKGKGKYYTSRSDEDFVRRFVLQNDKDKYSLDYLYQETCKLRKDASRMKNNIKEIKELISDLHRVKESKPQKSILWGLIKF